MTISRLIVSRLTVSRLIAAFAVFVLVAGCSAAGGPAATGSPSAAPSESILGVVGSRNPAASAVNGSAAPIDLAGSTVAPVVADVARRAGVPADQVNVVSAESMTFPDGSLGCPQPGMAYTQMVVDGYKIVVTANKITYDYRGTANGFRLCSQTPP